MLSGIMNVHCLIFSKCITLLVQLLLLLSNVHVNRIGTVWEAEILTNWSERVRASSLSFRHGDWHKRSGHYSQ